MPLFNLLSPNHVISIHHSSLSPQSVRSRSFGARVCPWVDVYTHPYAQGSFIYLSNRKQSVFDIDRVKIMLFIYINVFSYISPLKAGAARGVYASRPRFVLVRARFKCTYKTLIRNCIINNCSAVCDTRVFFHARVGFM
jgi:hypothetical protein